MSGKGKMSGKCKIVQDVISTVGMSREERLKMFMDTFTDEYKAYWDSDYDEEVDWKGRVPMKFRDYASYELDRIETEGFDIQDYSKFSNPGLLVRLHCPPEKSTSETFKAELQDCSCIAIDVYNRKHGTHYGNVHVVKANSQALSPCRYYITFQATDEKNSKETFQARVNISFSKLEKVPQLEKGPKFDIEVELVRIQTAPKPIVITRSPKASHREGQ